MTVVGRASGLNTERYVVELRAGEHELLGDEPEASGGTDRGPSPYGLVLAGLVSCTAITVRMYAERKSWPLRSVRVEATMTAGRDEGQRVERTLTIEGDLDDDQRSRLADIAERTPVTLTLKNGVTIDTQLEPRSTNAG